MASVVLNVLTLIGLASVASAQTMNLDNLPPIFQGLVPKPIKQFHASLNPAEKQALKAAHLRHEYHKDVLAELKQTHPGLYYKAKQLSVGFDLIMKNLQPEAGKFVQYVFLDFNRLIEKGRRPSELELRTAARDYINRYAMLSSAAKRAVQRALPEVTSYMESPRFRSFAFGRPSTTFTNRGRRMRGTRNHFASLPTRRAF